MFRKQLLDKRMATAKALEQVEADVEAELKAAVEFAEGSPEPSAEELYADVYVK
jgi:pyruvate dehydrogenase E1 component alpha subunit